MQFVYQPKRKKSRDGKGDSIASPLYRGRYRLAGMASFVDIPLHTTDRQVAEKMLKEIIVDLQKEASGLIPKRSVREAQQKPLLAHLKDYVTDLEVCGRDDEYTSHVNYRARIIFEALGWTTVAHLDPDGFRQWQAGQSRSKSAKTLNEYRNTLRSFCNWMLRNRRITENPFKLLPGLTVEGRERYVRRALSQDETARLLAVSGDRSLAYLVAVRTGLRRTELDTLAWGDLSLDTEDPTVAVRAENAKNRRRQSLPLRPEVAEALRNIRPAGWAKKDIVFPNGVPTMDIFKKDLAAAKIPYEDDEGRVVDFHSLRKTLCTDLCRSEVSPWQAMRLMRHSDIKLTVKNYSDEKQMELRKALGKLPALGTRGAAVSPPAAPAITQ